MKSTGLFFLLLLLSSSLWAQQYSLLADKPALEQVEEITGLIYNNEHALVQQKLKKLRTSVPADHPVFPMLQALNLYWMDAPMHTKSAYFPVFKDYLHQTVQHSEVYLARKQDETLASFLALSAHSLLTRFHADKGDYMAAIGEAKEAYSYMKEAFELAGSYNEFNFPVGLYNYYREKYPELHPVYKPFMFFFRSGDKNKGIRQLEQASRENIFTKPEATVFLVQIYLYYENKPKEALRNIRRLQQEFPQNRLFKAQLAEAYIANGQYQPIRPHIQYLLQQPEPFFKMAGELFEGLYLEKQLKDYEQALNSYTSALETGKSLNYMADVYRSMAYAGLGRIYHHRQQAKQARAAYKKALEYAAFEYPVKPEAKTYLE
ncbi:tetratricopeptide repeat protein [Nafulsella turpanensis]|uniref:tetratricopeptide repeat protein n=1 Tax=Nafulsella turpanensis TaxID=1265690 RepID=UPI000380ED35|nr:hypothetical protein [Nafulsella turpanensis]